METSHSAPREVYAVCLGRQHRPFPRDDAPDQGVDPVPGLNRSQGVVLDGRADVEGDLGGCVEAGVGNLVEDRVVPLVTDAGENGHRRLANELCEIKIIEPCQVGHRAPTTNQDQSVVGSLLVDCQSLEDGGLDRG